MTIDLSPLLNAVLQVAGPYILGGATIAGSWLAGLLIRRFHLQNEAQVRAVIQAGAVNAANYGLSKAGALGQSSVPVTIKNVAIAHGVQYLKDTLPGMIAKAKATDSGLAQIVEAKLAQAIPAAPAEPSTVVVAAPAPGAGA